ncbi:hypothetical protein [Nostoc sp.]|uniref:hypothetical protein n=1 Tax=Nostoc sp. TaxID=1180 RepID=UPI002FF6485E
MIKTIPTRDRVFGHIEDTIGFATAPKSDRLMIPSKNYSLAKPYHCIGQDKHSSDHSIHLQGTGRALAYPYGEASYVQRSIGKLTVGVASRREGIAHSSSTNSTLTRIPLTSP